MKTFFLYSFCVFGVLLFIPISLFSQNTPNDFKIGRFGVGFMNEAIDPPQVEFNGHPTSQLNIFSEDGFNIVSNYFPHKWSNLNEMENWLTLLNLHGLQMLSNAKDWHKPTNTNPHFEENDYCLNHGGTGQTGFWESTSPGTAVYGGDQGHLNYNQFYDNLYHQAQFVNTIWGHQVCEESTLFNLANSSSTVGPNFDCHDMNILPTGMIDSEMTLELVLNALSHFASKLSSNNITNQKLVVMEAAHSRGITEFLENDTEDMHDLNPSIEPYTAKHLIESKPYETVFLEGSYVRLLDDWINYEYQDIFCSDPLLCDAKHYLGFLKSIDFAKENSKDVHDVILIDPNSETNNRADLFHSNSVANADWLWFKTYTSIIHGATGIWFYHNGYLSHEKNAIMNADQSYSGNDWNNYPSRFERPSFPAMYNKFVAPLAKELRWLVEKDLLSTDENSIVFEKTDHKDKYCIVPDAKKYIPRYLPEEFQSENYGLRYTVRTNGDETVMIISNPLPIKLNNVVLDFSAIENLDIQNSTGADVLFATNQNIYDNSYKNNRETGYNWQTGAEGDQYHIPWSGNNNLILNFGPLDVHVLRFKDQTAASVYDNGWSKEWSNYGDGIIKSWGPPRDNDNYIAGDFNGDGDEELLCITGTNNSQNWASMFDYVNGAWEGIWTNNGDNTISWWGIQEGDKYYTGDFDGDSKDELLCVQSKNGIVEWAAVLQFESSGWSNSNVWINNGNGYIDSWEISPTDKFIVGDFDNDNRDELFCIQAASDYNQSASILNFTSNSWTSQGYWTNNGNNLIDSWNMSAADRWFSGDFNNLGFDQLLGVQGDGPYMGVLTFDQGTWNWGYNNNGNHVAGWTFPVPISDEILVGDLDYGDPKSELMFIQNQWNGAWAATMDMIPGGTDWVSNWWATGNNPRINDWDIASETDQIRYLIIRPDLSKPAMILAFRYQNEGACQQGGLISMYYSSTFKKTAEKEESSAESITSPIVKDKSGKLWIFPNPGQDNINVDLTLIDSPSEVSVYNSIGQLISIHNNLDGNTVVLDMSSQSSGIYLIQIKCNSGIIQEKLMITK